MSVEFNWTRVGQQCVFYNFFHAIDKRSIGQIKSVEAAAKNSGREIAANGIASKEMVFGVFWPNEGS